MTFPFLHTLHLVFRQLPDSDSGSEASGAPPFLDLSYFLIAPVHHCSVPCDEVSCVPCAAWGVSVRHAPVLDGLLARRLPCIAHSPSSLLLPAQPCRHEWHHLLHDHGHAHCQHLHLKLECRGSGGGI